MLIRYPTGLYYSALPHVPSDQGDVTFTISGSPPVTIDTFLKLPPGLEQRPLAAALPIIDAKTYLGDLVYTTISAQRTALGNSAAQYSIGDVLEFGSAADILATVPVLPSTDSEYQYNLNTLDYQAMGLTTADEQYIENLTYTQYLNLKDQLNQLKQDYLALQVIIGTDQKELNEIKKALTALSAVTSADTQYAAIITQLQAQQTAINQRTATNVATTTTMMAQITTVASQLQALSMVAK